MELIAGLRETIAQQSNDLTIIRAEQRVLQNQNAELQQAVKSLQAQLTTHPADPSSTQTWASVAIRYQAESEMTLSQMTNTSTVDKEGSRQLVIDTS